MDNSQVRNEKLLPCPWHTEAKLPPVPSGWCLGTAEELQMGEDKWAYQVRCYCGAQGPEADTEAEAIAAWNTRPHTTGDSDLVEVVARVLWKRLYNDPPLEWPGFTHPDAAYIVDDARAVTAAIEATLSTQAAEIERLRGDRNFLIACLDMCDEAEAPPCELDAFDRVILSGIKSDVTRQALQGAKR